MNRLAQRPATFAAASLFAVAALTALAATSVTTGSPDVSVQVYQQGRRPAPDPPTPVPRGTSTLTVTVVTEDGTGVKGARVAVIQVPSQPAGSASAPGQAAVTPMTPAVRDRAAVLQKQARTALGGVATFTGLPGGTFAVSAMPPSGYVTRVQVERVDVPSGGQAAATVKVLRGGVVTGRIIDEDGDPVTGAVVSITRVSRLGGLGQTGNYATQPTNDLGAYRVWGLAAGDYVISTHFEDRQPPAEEGAAAPDGYLPTYFPGVPAFDAARPVQVRAGQETGGIDIQILRGRLGAISGRVTDASGAGVGGGGQGGVNATVSISPRGSNPGFTQRGTGARSDGTFLIPNVPAGDYYVSASISRGAGASPVREAGYVPVTVNGDEVSVAIQTNYGASVSGRVVLEGAPPPQSGLQGPASGRQAQIRVSARPATSQYAGAFSSGSGGGPGAAGAPQQGQVRPDGTFTLTGLRGPLLFAATAARAALKEVRRGAADVSGQPVELLGTERIDDLVVVMTYDTGTIEAVLEDDESLPATGTVALVVPEDPDKWSAGSPFIRTARVAAASPAPSSSATPGAATAAGQGTASGTAAPQLNNLPAGRYLVLAFAEGLVPALPDRSIIERLREFGTSVTVDPGQTTTVKVKAIR